MNIFKKIVCVILIVLFSVHSPSLFAQEAQSSWLGVTGKVLVGAGGIGLSVFGFGAGYFVFKPMQKNWENMSKLSRAQVNYDKGRMTDAACQSDSETLLYNSIMRKKIPHWQDRTRGGLAEIATACYSAAAQDYNEVQRQYYPNWVNVSANQVSENPHFIRQASESKLQIELVHAEYFADSQQRKIALTENRVRTLKQHDGATQTTVKGYEILAARPRNCKYIAYGVGFLGAITAVCSLKSSASK